MESRAHFAKLNIYVTFICQILTMVCGIILPRVFIRAYGSELYGATSSITQFLAYITLLEGGICGVARSVLYKPLSNNDYETVGAILFEIKKFFRVIGAVFFVYVIVLACCFKQISHIQSYDWISTFMLVIAISISTFAQYFIGISYSVLLQAAQRAYVTNVINIIGAVTNTIMVVILTSFDCSLVLVKLISSCVFALKPLFLVIYARRVFPVPNVKSNQTLLKDKWVALGQHIAFFLHSHADIAILTIFNNLASVAIYTIYSMVVNAIQNLLSSFSTGMEALFGDMYARKEIDLLRNTFGLYESIISITSLILFSTTATMIIPFVRIYTRGVEDANYIIPLFGLLLTIAALLFSLRTPYHAMVIAAGHFKQTNVAAYGEAIINISSSIVLVHFYGLIGVAIGTVAATLFRYLFYVYYLSKTIINRKITSFLKRIILNALVFGISCICGEMLISHIQCDNYFRWILCGVVAFLVSCGITLIVYILFYNQDCKSILKKARRR